MNPRFPRMPDMRGEPFFFEFGGRAGPCEGPGPLGRLRRPGHPEKDETEDCDMNDDRNALQWTPWGGKDEANPRSMYLELAPTENGLRTELVLTKVSGLDEWHMTLRLNHGKVHVDKDFTFIEPEDGSWTWKDAQAKAVTAAREWLELLVDVSARALASAKSADGDANEKEGHRA